METPRQGVGPNQSGSRDPRCFVSTADAGAQRSLAQTLVAAGVQPVFPEDLPLGPTTAVDSIHRAIASCDLVLGVITEKGDNGNVMFELGLAFALAKPVLALVPRQMTVPGPLDRQFVIRGDVSDYEAIRFAVEPLARRVARTSTTVTAASTKLTLGQSADGLLARLANLDESARETDLLSLLADVFRYLDLTAVVGGSDARFDFGIWDAELGPVVGNPFVIEVKHALRSGRDVGRALSQVEGYLEATAGRWALLLYRHGDGSLINDAAWDRPVLTASIDQLIDALRDTSFAEFVRRLRSERVHGNDLSAR